MNSNEKQDKKYLISARISEDIENMFQKIIDTENRSRTNTIEHIIRFYYAKKIRMDTRN